MSDTDAGWVPDTAAAPRTTERRERHPFEADTSRTDGTETPGEIVYVRRAKLEALLTQVNLVASEVEDDSPERDWRGVAEDMAKLLTAALSEFDAPHIPEVELTTDDVESATSGTIDEPKLHRWQFRRFATARQERLLNATGPEGLTWMETAPDFCMRVEPEDHFQTHGNIVSPETIAAAGHFEEWLLYDFTSYGGPRLGWQIDRNEPPGFRALHLRWAERTWSEGPWSSVPDPGPDPEQAAVMLKIYEWLRSEGATEPSEFIASMFDEAARGG